MAGLDLPIDTFIREPTLHNKPGINKEQFLCRKMNKPEDDEKRLTVE